MPSTRRDASALLCCAASALLAGCAAPTPTHDTISTRRLNLVDDAGAVLATLGVDEDGAAGLFLLDTNGRNRAALIHDAGQTALYLFDGDETIRIGVAQFAHGGGGVALHGEESKGAAVLYLKDGLGSLAFYDENGERIGRTPE